MRFAHLTFQIAGIYGVLVVTPLFFLEKTFNATSPVVITHPEYYYGFACVTFAWQVLFLVVARDPVRYRAIMLMGVVEKISGLAFILLVLLQRAPPALLLLGSIDVLLGIAFLMSYLRTPATPAYTAPGVAA